MASVALDRAYNDLPPCYMAAFTDIINKCVDEWGYLNGLNKPRFIAMMFCSMVERRMVDLSMGVTLYKPNLTPAFEQIIKEHSVFLHSPFSENMNNTAISALQSVYLMDEDDYLYNIDFWETVLMDVLSSIVHVSTVRHKQQD